MTIDTSKIAEHVVANWKTSAQGVIGASIAVVLAVMVLPPTASKLVIALAVLKALAGFIQKDAQ